MANIDELLMLLARGDGSDLHLASGAEPRMRMRGELLPIEGRTTLVDADLLALMREITSSDQWADYETSGDLDFAYGIEGVARFRANYLRQEHGAAAVFRIIPTEIQSSEQLGLPPVIESLGDLEKGLVLVTGPTGSGKSTTLAAVIDAINRKYSRHIVTIEDPVEFVHPNKKSILSHREVGAHSQGFGPALRSAIRQDADVVMVGEMRDRETVSLAITAAEMGMLVFGTLHTNNAAKTVDRIVDAFPAKEQNQVRISLSESLAGIVSQLLVPTVDGKGRCPVHEILLRTPGLPNVIREGKVSMINSIIESGKSLGMQSMDDSLHACVEAGRIRPLDAYLKAINKARFEALVPEQDRPAA